MYWRCNLFSVRQELNFQYCLIQFVIIGDSSVGTEMGFGLDSRGSIPG
jgi:hypothetical protein